MSWIWKLNLIHLFDFYLAMVFVVSTALRLRQYKAVIRLVRAVPDRWPRLLRLIRQHHGIFLTWATVLPAFLALVLYLLHTIAYRFLWPHANLTVGELRGLWFAVAVIALSGVGMLAVDGYATFRVGNLDRALLETYFDQAEFWLRSWVAPVVKVFTLGYINPRKMVAAEVSKALVQASRLLNSTLWWLSIQVGLRIAFGLSLWMTWGWIVQ